MSRDRVAAYWSDHDFTDHLARIHWMGSPEVRAYLNQLVSGDPAADWLTWALHRPALARRRPRPGEAGWRVLVLGCGTGWLERSLARRPQVASIDACDVAEGAVREAAETARREGLGGTIRYHVVDLNEEPPPGGLYDLAVAHSVLHHVENLELAYPALRDCLVPGGLLLLNEYVGPRRFQWSGEQMAVINAVLARLPERYRRSAVMGGALYPHKEVPTEAQMIATDPSESVRSDELLAFTRRHFEVLEEVAYGGTVLQQLLYDVVQNFDPARLADARLLGLACLLEEALMREGVLPSDYAVVLARRPEEPRNDRDIPRVGTPHGSSGASRGGPEQAGRLRTPTSPEPVEGRGPLVLVPPQPVPRAVPVRRLAAAAAGSEPLPAPRRTIHSRPLRDRRHGMELPPVRRHLHRLATGDPDCPWITWVLGRLLSEEGGSPGRALVIEEPPAWLGPAVAAAPRVVAVDTLVPSFDEKGRLRLASDGTAPRPAAEALAALAPAAYRFVFANGWLGRAPDRAGTARALLAALAPGGLLIGDEWLGPADGRTTPRTLRYARELAELLQPAGAPAAGWKERLRARLVEIEHGGLRRRFGPPEPELGTLLGPAAEILVERPTGGALLQRVLPAAADLWQELSGDGADPGERDAALAFAALAALTEERLTDAGAVDAEYACFVARRRD
jgi:SAM-dependent methyltransferase